MNERFLRFQSADTELVGTLSLPQGSPCGAILIVHPFGEEKKFAHRVLTAASWQLAEAGFATLRFDLSGCGDSFGRFRDATIAQWQRDIITAANLLRREAGCEKISLLGLRLGATLCWLGRDEVGDLDAVVLWEPVLSGRKYVDILWRRKLIKEMMTAGRGRTSFEAARAKLEQTGFIDLDGWDLGKTMVDELIELDIGKPARPATSCPGRILAVQIAFNAKVSNELDAFADAVRLAKGSIDVAGIRERPIWDRIDIVPATELIAITTNWLSQSQT